MIGHPAFEPQPSWEFYGAVPFLTYEGTLCSERQMAGCFKPLLKTQDEDHHYALQPISSMRFSLTRQKVKCDAKQEPDSSMHAEPTAPLTRSQIAQRKLISKVGFSGTEKSHPNLRSRIKVPRGRFRKHERNALTNIGNQLLTYLSTRMRCNYDIERLFPAITPEDKEAYFQTMKGLKQHLYGYISERKLIELWAHVEEPDHFHWVIIRALSHYFLRDQMVCSVATSIRLPSHYKPTHYSVRRKLLVMLYRRSAC